MSPPDAFDAPFHPVVLPLVMLVAAFLGSAVWLSLASLPYRRLPADTHWTVRARQWMSFRISGVTTLIWTAMLTAAACAVWARTSILLLLLLSATAIVGVLAGGRIARLGMAVPSALKDSWVPGTLVLWTVVAPGIPMLFLLMAINANRTLNGETLLITAGVIGAVILWCMGPNLCALRLLGILRPVSPEMQASVDRLAAATATRVRRASVLQLPMANAFAFPWRSELVFTPGLIDVLDEDERNSVIAHELGHLREPISMHAARLAGLGLIGVIGLSPATAKTFELPGTLCSLAAYFIGTRLLGRFGRKAEENADASAKETEASEGTYARALEKIHAASLIPAVLNRNATHPHLYDRMIKAGITPEYARPQPPSKVLALIFAILATLTNLVLTFLLMSVLSGLLMAWSPKP